MRPRRNDSVGSQSDPSSAQAGDGTDDPIRRCILTGERAARDRLVRLAISPDGEVLPDVRAKAPGRGAWIGVSRTMLVQAIAKGRLRGALARAYKGQELTVPADLPDRIATALERAALDRLGLEARSGNLLTGTEKIAAAARAGQVRLLLHAADAGDDGARRLAQAWRVGQNAEGTDLKGLALPVPRPILSLALGRENVVHIALTDPDAADRVRDALDRWLYYIGPDLGPSPCETASQGASALPNAPGPADDDQEEIE